MTHSLIPTAHAIETHGIFDAAAHSVTWASGLFIAFLFLIVALYVFILLLGAVMPVLGFLAWVLNWGIPLEVKISHLTSWNRVKGSWKKYVSPMIDSLGPYHTAAMVTALIPAVLWFAGVI